MFLAVACVEGAPAPSAAPPTIPGACAVPSNASLPFAACEVVAKAKNERSLAVLASAGDTKLLTAAFERYFGLGGAAIAYEFSPSARRPDVRLATQRALTESDAQLRALDWAALFGTRAEELIDRGKAIWTYDEFPAGLVYDAALVKPEELPKTYADLLDPKWKGRIVMLRSATTLAYLALAVADPGATGEGLRIARGLVGDPSGNGQVRLAPSSEEVRKRVVSGEFALGFGVDGGRPILAAAVVEQGIDPIPMAKAGCAVPFDARSPHLAMLFCYWLATPDGRPQSDAVLGLSRHTTPASRAARYVGTKRLIIPTVDFEAKGLPELERKLGSLL